MNTKATIRWRGVKWGCLAAGFVMFAGVSMPAAADRVGAPMLCNKGPSGQLFVVRVTAPTSVEVGSTYTVRIDGVSSGKISHVGLNHLHDMTVEYALPSGASYVEGSAKLVPGTGTANVLASARVWYQNGILTMNLPDKVENGESYTPPSIQLKLKATGSPGSAAALGFNQYHLKANAVVVGDVAISCTPPQKPYTIEATQITAATRVAGN
jgi:hypothetical protein